MSKQCTHSTTLSDWHRQDIMAAIRKKGTTLAELGRQHGYESPAALYNVFNMSYPKVERIIAAFLESHPSEIWPSRYQKSDIDFKTSISLTHLKK
ncbi:DNA-binding transcriptional regulator Nlp [Marinomonas spartinae]|uniref:DNA-binding transcriptional regulator Nlp n=1 Tax=Marinomonas spartinae TaxID=1792290 RepID=A0A1A8TCN9_9GAMM|nr:helix-turn-helix transcriptional regulator [Marinomonas spartinae]MBJ7553125.1 helix-turn-helix domain-containing protein [Marinomonas spartinae]SBS30523.1 DNA-binding transcriptional regulator Nlp [Marinomonas spartinae]SBS36551.1 DNA-binding transcriptional regulator Nlp [Marinomonas spartinae]